MDLKFVGVSREGSSPSGCTVAVAELAMQRTVDPLYTGSSPVGHPTEFLEQNILLRLKRKMCSSDDFKSSLMGYGVMAAQQTLTLSVLVRIQIPQRPPFRWDFNISPAIMV